MAGLFSYYIFSFNFVLQVTIDAYLVKRTNSHATVCITIRNRQEKHSVFVALKFSAHKSAMYEQLIYPLMAGLHEIKGGEVWEKSVEVYETKFGDWATFEVFSATLEPKRVWSQQRATVKLSAPGDW